MEKTMKEFSAMYRKALTARGNQKVDAMVMDYLKRLEQMYASTYTSSMMSTLL